MKKIMLITTGGTIASLNYKNGLKPSIDGNDLLNYIPSIRKKCDVDVLSMCSLDSTNIYHKHWLQLAKIIQENYERYDGFIIAHGTDTLAYTASALSYLIQNSRKPIVLTGAQKPINLDVSDAKINLKDSFTYVLDENAKGVVVIFNGNVILGSRARKVRTKSYNAFASIDYPSIGIIQDDRYIPYIKDLSVDTKFYDKLNPNVALFKLIPGTNADILDYILKNNEAVVIESFGVGGLPTYEDNKYNEIIDKAEKDKKIIVMTTQVPNEGSDIAIYQVGHHLKQYKNVLEAYDMPIESIVTKLMWILSITKNIDEVNKLFYQNINNDILFKK